MAILETSTILDALSPEQREIVTCLEGPVLVLARVGSGKTRVLAHRAAYALIAGPFGGERSVGLALTFTNRAAEEMLERLEGLLSPALNGRVSVCTFHALAARILRAEGKRIGVLPSFQVYDDTESGELLEHVMGRLHVPWTDNDVQQYGRAIASAKNRGAYPYRLGDDEADLRAIYSRYQYELARCNALDYDDLLAFATRLLEVDASARERWQKRFAWIEVDEVQDVGMAEYGLVRILAAEHGHICLLGDTAQSIYGWRGVDSQALVDRFEADFPAVRRFHLEHNFRSTGAILNLADTIIGHEPSAAAGDSAPHLHLVDDQTAEFQAIAQYVSELLSAEDCAPREIAVLCRTNAQVRHCTEYLASRAIPCATLARSQFFRSAEIRDALAYLRLAARPDDSRALWRVTSRAEWSIGPELLRRAQRDADANGLLLTDLVDRQAVERGDPCADALECWTHDAVVLDLETTGTDPSVDEVVEVAALRTDFRQRAEWFEALVRVERPVGASIGVHGISDEQLRRDGQPTNEVLPGLLEFIGPTPLVGHNIGFDQKVLEAGLGKLGYTLAPRPCLDTLSLARRLEPTDRYDLRWLAQHLKFPAVPDHRARADVEATGRLFHHLCRRLDSATAERRQTLAAWAPRFARLAEHLDGWRALAKTATPAELFRTIMQESGYRDALEKRSSAGAQRARLEELERKLDEKFPEPGLESLDAFLAWAPLVGDAGSLRDEDGVRVLTIHAAKGLEFDGVVVTGLYEGNLPLRRGPDELATLTEERRLCYVAVTRARRHVALTAPRQIIRNGRPTPVEPSRFLPIPSP